VNVNVTAERIYFSASIQARLQTFQPQDAMYDGRIGQALPGEPHRLSPAKYRSHGIASAHFACDAMQPKRGLLRIHHLPDPKAGGGHHEAAAELIMGKRRGRPRLARALP
jgi:hypothetical protein